MSEDAIKYTCFCGAHGTFEELHDMDGLDKKCGGTGMLYCYCGGDLCVCHNHGEVECFGCEDCENNEYLDGEF